MVNDKLASNFIVELFSAAFHRRTMMDIIKQYLKFSFLQVESEKKIWQWATKSYEKTGRIPTFGQLQQNFIDDEDCLDKLVEVIDIEEGEDAYYENLIATFESFIKQMKFLEANEAVVTAYNSGKKENSYDLFVKYAEEISKFSIQDAKFETVFGDFNERQIKRRSVDYNFRYKVPTGIDELDFRLGGISGGPESGECVLWLGDSGAGKSQCLVHIGVAAARQGHRVAHFQLEGTREQCLNRYDACWTGTLYQDVKLGDITQKKIDIAQKIIKKLHKSDIIVSSEETFGGKTLVDVRRELKVMERVHGKIDVIIIDYLELLEVGDGHSYSPSEERFRQTKLSRGMKQLAMEFNAVVHTATQSNSISEEDRNDPNFVVSRSNLSEDRGKIRPFDIFITINQTRDEMRDEVMRLHTDKLRDYKYGDVIFIINNFAYSRFYDRKKTLNASFNEDQ
jgi:replicative DNA helicase